MKKVVLAYSGGLDTSVILKWLQEEKNLDVITYTADLGQGDISDDLEGKAKSLGASKVIVEDLTEEFISDYVFPMFRCNAIFEGEYLLGTAIARPLIAKKLVEIGKSEDTDIICHGATGKGNDQIRFELGYYALNPKIKVIAPWREWNLKSRKDLIEYAKKSQISVSPENSDEPPYSMDANLLHTSYEGKILEDPWAQPNESMYTRTISCEDAPNTPTIIDLEFFKGDLISINGEKLSPAKLLARLNKIGGENGIGRIDIVENRFVGMKSRGVYETPGGEILLASRRAIESITLDKSSAHLKDELMPKYAELIYNGFWFSPEREMLQSLIDKSQSNVEGTVKLKIYKGNIIILGRKSKNSLYSSEMATFEEDSIYNQKDAEGFIKLNALRLKLLKHRR